MRADAENVWGSPWLVLVWAALALGCAASTTDVWAMASDVSEGLYRYIAFESLPGAMAAWFLNLLFNG
jgi:hypothetical protein